MSGLYPNAGSKCNDGGCNNYRLVFNAAMIIVKKVSVISPFLNMQKGKYNTKETIIIILAWVMALSLMYLACVKFKLFFK